MYQSYRPGFAGDGLRPRSSGLRRSRLAAHAGPRTRAAFEAATQLVFNARLVANHVIPAKPGCPSRRGPSRRASSLKYAFQSNMGPGFRRAQKRQVAGGASQTHGTRLGGPLSSLLRHLSRGLGTAASGPGAATGFAYPGRSLPRISSAANPNTSASAARRTSALDRRPAVPSDTIVRSR
jgi:hypothetical protein